MGAIGFILPLVQSILSGFSGGNQAQLNPIISQVAGLAGGAPPTPGSKDEQIIKFATDTMAMVLHAAGMPPNANDAQKVQATAKVLSQPELMKPIEDDAMARFEKMGPVFDRLIAVDKMTNEAVIAGRESALKAQLADTHGVVLMVAKSITRTKAWSLAGLGVAIVVAMICKAVWPQTPDYVLPLLTLIGPLLGAAFKESGAVVAHYFDGTPSSNAANAMNAEIAATRK